MLVGRLTVMIVLIKYDFKLDMLSVFDVVRLCYLYLMLLGMSAAEMQALWKEVQAVQQQQQQAGQVPPPSGSPQGEEPLPTPPAKPATAVSNGLPTPPAGASGGLPGLPLTNGVPEGFALTRKSYNYTNVKTNLWTFKKKHNNYTGYSSRVHCYVHCMTHCLCNEAVTS